MDKEFTNNIKEIYSLLKDDLSKEIFGYRLLYNLTDDEKYMQKVERTTSVCQNFLNQIEPNKKLILFGCGRFGKNLLGVFDDIKFECFVDNNHVGETCMGLPVIDFENLKQKYKNDIVIISSYFFHTEIFEQLLEGGFKKENIIDFGKEYENLLSLQYFDLPELKSNIRDKEIFIDGGCFNGENSCEFKKWCDNSGVKETFVYAMEPDPINIEACKVALNSSQFKLINKGLWSEKAQLHFNIAAVSSSVCDNGAVTVEVDSIDNLIDGPVTFIKMDIEGAEYEALLGAKETIKKYKPKLAICVYHKPEDIWEIPKLIHRFNPGYRFYLRHYSFAEHETVLYAIDTNN